MRRRGKNPNESPGVRPVERIELSEKSPKKRLIVVIALVAFALLMFGIAIFSALEQPAGWTQIEPSYVTADSVASEFVFNYYLGASGASPQDEYRELSALYAELCHSAYTLFDADLAFEDVKNLYYISTHIGEEISVNPALYDAFALFEQYGSRQLYAAPYYDQYSNLFSMTEDGMAVEFDPYSNTELAQYYAQIAEYINDESHIKLELLGNNKVKLTLSDEYKSFAEANYIDRFLDFYWMKNAFVVDFIADAIEKNGFVYGYIVSKDGFTRNLDPGDTLYSMNLPAKYEGEFYNSARYDYKGRNSIVFLRSYKAQATDEIYYTYKNGEVRHAYVDVTDGLCRASLDGLIAYSKDRSCAEVLIEMIPVFIADELDSASLTELADSGIYSIRLEGIRLIHTQKDILLTVNTSFESIKFSAELAE